MLLRVIFLLFILVCNSYYLTANDCSKTILMADIVKKYHVQPALVNDDFSKNVFHQMLERLDPYKQYFSSEDIQLLRVHETKIDDYILSGSCDFVTAFSVIFKKKVLKYDSLTLSALAGTITFSEKDSVISQTHEKYISSAALAKYYKSYIKYCILYEIAHKTELKDNKLVLTEAQWKAALPEAKNAVKKKIKKGTERILQHKIGYEELIRLSYFKAIMHSFDPHSDYMSQEEKDIYESFVSASNMSFGLEFTETGGGELLVTKVVPGSAAWNSNSINNDDLLESIKIADSAPVDFTNSTNYELSIALTKVNLEEVSFTFRKPNGSTYTVNLKKTSIKSDGNIINSFVLGDKVKIGYIYLPSFYNDYENDNNLGCANDITKEILKLKAEKIEGLIFDVRNNGGGSLKEAIELLGIFIDEGPLSIIKTNEPKPYVLKDINRGTVYDGPLLVLANGLSASASELFASTIQEYNRGLIVGANTFGKATGQEIIPMDTTLDASNPMLRCNDGFLKITCLKIYKTNGKTHQKSGVQADISLPGNYMKEYAESTFPTALSSDSITKKTTIMRLQPLAITSLRQKSEGRINSSKEYVSYVDLLGMENKFFNKMYIPVSYTGFTKYWDKKNEIRTMLQNTQYTSVVDVKNHSYDMEILKYESFDKEMNTIALEKTKNDIEISEAYHILIDQINK